MFKSEIFASNHINNRHSDIIKEKLEKEVIDKNLKFIINQIKLFIYLLYFTLLNLIFFSFTKNLNWIII